MKNISIYLSFMVMLNMFSYSVFSQSIKSTAAQISATIVEPVSMLKTDNTNFGHVAIILAGYVKMIPVASRSRKGNIVLPVSSGTFTAATYDISGTSGYSYTFSFPPAPMIFNNGTNLMQVASLDTSPAQNSDSDLIAGVFVSVTPGNVIVSYN
jgi:hypothetical protein